MGEGNIIFGAGGGDPSRVTTESWADFGTSGTRLEADWGTGYTTCPPNGRDLIGSRRAARGRRTAA